MHLKKYYFQKLTEFIKMRCIVNLTAQITMQDDINVVAQTLSELQLFFSKQDMVLFPPDTFSLIVNLFFPISRGGRRGRGEIER
jgi:hypothetical protein